MKIITSCLFAVAQVRYMPRPFKKDNNSALALQTPPHPLASRGAKFYVNFCDASISKQTNFCATLAGETLFVYACVCVGCACVCVCAFVNICLAYW